MEKRLEGGLLNMFSYSLEGNSRDNKDILPVSRPLATLDKYFINAKKRKKRVFFIVVEAVFSPNSVLLFHTLFIISDISFIFLFEARLSPVL